MTEEEYRKEVEARLDKLADEQPGLYREFLRELATNLKGLAQDIRDATDAAKK